jgi:hypothetical protein
MTGGIGVGWTVGRAVAVGVGIAVGLADGGALPLGVGEDPQAASSIVAATRIPPARARDPIERETVMLGRS